MTPTPTLRIALAQLNLTVGDLRGNLQRLLAAAEEAVALKADLLLAPELALTGYPAEDLLLRRDFIIACQQTLGELVTQLPAGLTAIIGLPLPIASGGIANGAVVIRNGAIIDSYHKQQLPNYGVFDELRWFTAGSAPCVTRVNGHNIGIALCEDSWQSAPIAAARHAGAGLILVLNASPYHLGKQRERQREIAARVAESGLAIAYLNLVGGQDDLLFDGQSFVMNPDGAIAAALPPFVEEIAVIEFERHDERLIARSQPLPASPTADGELYQALVLALRDYVEKNRFPRVIIGLSGGIDSALTLAVAVDALGADRVEAVTMPSRYTATISVEDALAEAAALGVPCATISIEPIFQQYLHTLSDRFNGLAPDITEENLQARCRGTLLMAIANKCGGMVITTGNKSEIATGYATLYGDMAGGFDLLKDLLKGQVYRLARYRNQIAPVIPERVITRAPSAELAPDQKDSDSLPPYDLLDTIIQRYIEEDESASSLIASGLPADVVRRVIELIERNEYKRRQGPLGVKLSRRAFGRDRRYPVTHRYRSN
jgi:NAD+ synthase (glutamine-hydrolysing)